LSLSILLGGEHEIHDEQRLAIDVTQIWWHSGVSLIQIIEAGL